MTYSSASTFLLLMSLCFYLSCYLPGGTRKPGSSIVYRLFQGQIEITTRQRRSSVLEKNKGAAGEIASLDGGKSAHTNDGGDGD